MDDDFELEESIEAEDVPPPKPRKAKKPKKAKEPKAVPANGGTKTKKPKRELDEFGLARGSVRSRAAALYAREGGATLQEVAQEVGIIQFNVLTKLKKDGFEITATKEAGEKNRTVSRYYLHRK